MLATSTHCFDTSAQEDVHDAKVPESARRNLAGPQALLGFKFLFNVLHASGCAIVFVVGAMVVEHIMTEVWRPVVRILAQVSGSASCVVWQKDCGHLSCFA